MFRFRTTIHSIINSLLNNSGSIFVALLNKTESKMNSKRYLTAIIVLSFFTFMIFACSFDTKTSQSYLIQTDSIRIPDVITTNVLFQVRLFGTIGPNNCYSFEKIYNYNNAENEITIEVWGNYYYDGTACTGSVKYLDEEADLTITSPGTYTLKILQPDFRYLEKEITVN